MDGFQIARDMLARDYIPTRESMRCPSWESRVAHAATLDAFAGVDYGIEVYEWQDYAACKGAEQGLFFSERGEDAKVHEAKAICAVCPVVDECLNYALSNNERFGVWGGKSEAQRRRMRGQRARGAA